MESTRLSSEIPNFLFEVWIRRLIEISEQLHLPTIPLTDLFEVRAFAFAFENKESNHFQKRMVANGVEPASVDGVTGTFFHARQVYHALVGLVSYGDERNGKAKASSKRRRKPPG